VFCRSNKGKGKMTNEPVITLHCILQNGRRETTELTHHTLPVAREVAKWVLQAGNGLYTEVNLCTEDGSSETIRSTAPAPTVLASEVLLVEDNAGDALLVGQALAECQISVHLHIARDGEQALQILKERDFKPDLVILDLNIPKMSGYTVLSLYRPKKTAVIVFSASENETDVDRALSLGAKDYVHKPMDLDEYKDAVCEMVRKWVPRERS
jgi:chemotaxis family two-component system response regulator Rcp1